MDKLGERLQKISSNFYDVCEISFFPYLLNQEITNLSKPVLGIDSLRTHAIDLCNIFDRVNKKAFDKFTGINSKGSKTSLINILKILRKDDHDDVNTISDHLDMIYLFRDYLTHGKNKNINKASDFFKCNIKHDPPKVIWQKITISVDDLLSKIEDFLIRPTEQLHQRSIDDDIFSVLIKNEIDLAKATLFDPKIKRILTYLLTENKILDIELAKIFEIEIGRLRGDMLVIYPKFIEISPRDRASTFVSIKQIFRDELKNFYSEQQ